jgi:hypothetical protein
MITKNPEVGNICNAFDDGKISYNRMFKVKVTKKLNLKKDKVSKRLLKLINYNIKEYPWLYSTKQDIIYRGKALKDDDKYNKIIGYQWFIRTKDNRWFGVGNDWFDALLDVDGRYLRELEK